MVDKFNVKKCVLVDFADKIIAALFVNIKKSK